MNGNPLIVENRLLGLGDSGFNDPNCISMMMLLEPVSEGALRGIDHAGHHSQVGFLQRPLTNLICQSGCRLGGLGKDHHSTHRAIQALHQSQEYLARLLVTLLAPALEQTQQIWAATVIIFFT